MTPPPLPVPEPSRQDLILLRFVASLHFIVAVLCFAGILGFVYMTFAFSHLTDALGNHGNPEANGSDMLLKLMVGTTTFMNLLLALLVIIHGLCGMNLLRLRHQRFTMVFSAIMCLVPPVGTVLGICTLLMLSRDSVRASFTR